MFRLIRWMLALVAAPGPAVPPPAPPVAPIDFDDSEVTICGECRERVTRCVCLPRASLKRWRWALLSAALLVLVAFGLHPTEQAQRTKNFLNGAEYPFTNHEPGCDCGMAR